MRNLFQFLFGQAPQENGLEGTVVVPEIKQSVSLQIIMLMEQYIQENSSKLTLPASTEDYAKLLSEHKRLTDIGLGNTKNAKIIQQSIDNFQANFYARQKAEDLVRFIKELRRHFGESTVLISTEQFETLLKKYNLATGTLDEYTGTIPDKNIREVENAVNKTKYFRYKLNNPEGRKFLWKFDEVELSSSSRDDLEPYLMPWFKSKRGLIYADIGSLNYEKGVWLRHIKHCNPDIPERVRDYTWETLVNFKGKLINSSTMFIACPPSQLKEQSLKITHKAIDPIVFQYSEYGVVIHSIWGEEAEDKVFEEYKRVNQLLSL